MTLEIFPLIGSLSTRLGGLIHLLTFAAGMVALIHFLWRFEDDHDFIFSYPALIIPILSGYLGTVIMQHLLAGGFFSGLATLVISLGIFKFSFLNSMILGVLSVILFPATFHLSMLAEQIIVDLLLI